MMKIRNILIATPLKGDIPSSYFRTSLQLASARLPDVKLDWILLEGPAVQMARNEIVAYARGKGFDELIFWDKDVLAEDHTPEGKGADVTIAGIVRLLSHDVDIVCAPYSARHLDTHWHIHTISGEQPNDKGLQKVSRACIGFSKIKLSVFDKIEADNLDRKGVLMDPNHPIRPCTEFFPMGICGKNTPEHRMKMVKSIISDTDTSDKTKIGLIERELNLRYDEPNYFLGEDYWFCDLAISSGFAIYLDTYLVMGHRGAVTLPIPTTKLFQLMSESWRQPEIKAIKQQLLKPKTPDIVT